MHHFNLTNWVPYGLTSNAEEMLQPQESNAPRCALTEKLLQQYSNEKDRLEKLLNDLDERKREVTGNLKTVQKRIDGLSEDISGLIVQRKLWLHKLETRHQQHIRTLRDFQEKKRVIEELQDGLLSETALSRSERFEAFTECMKMFAQYHSPLFTLHSSLKVKGPEVTIDVEDQEAKIEQTNSLSKQWILQDVSKPE
ncbi:hypothetical protein EG68_05558 [Paragonimus skrjabini miyazakii]|uniref:Uncharacterized protein n=1 Tax=Paragonimus skrjabini miyazakii TaxID=59628 RepID=A0A8S9YP39_9TREM|nr:hypothetical protein EG68_05558 [Paragonimus skrjabini miyazakii]